MARHSAGRRAFAIASIANPTPCESTSGEFVREILLRKTGALIAASLVLGAIVANARAPRLA